MSWDYSHGYPGGSMVAVRGFPRPLYPPDAAEQGKKPSSDGSDVEAYKRTVSRAGRWVWQAFDQAYSNGFAHGKGPNVVDSGVAGIQRQQNMDDTGWIGEPTFNALRSIIVPMGLPHAGEHAMDARAVELINMAWGRFGGSELDEPPAGDAATARLKKAQKEIGYRESPSNSNQNKYGSWYGMNGVPWCAIFVTWADQMGGDPTPSFHKSSYYSYVPYIVSDARAGRRGLTVTSAPRPGDPVCYDWAWDGEHDHIGLFEGWTGVSGEFTAIEGNTSTSDQSNGGQVMRRTRNRNEQGTVFVRVAD